MTRWLRRLFNIRPGEGQRSALIYVLYFLLVLGSTWGELAAKALFLDAIGTDRYSVLFVAEAIFTLVFTLLYFAFVDRVNNAVLLFAICVVTGLSLIATGLLLAPGLPVAFYLYYLISRATRVIFTVHTWTYIGDFYDTRAARRLFPLIGSAGRIAGFSGGLAFPLVVRAIRAENTPYLWIGLLVVSAWLSLAVPRWTRNTAVTTASGQSESVLTNFRGGWQAIGKSRLLQLLAIGAVTMTILLALLDFQADYIFRQNYDSAEELGSMFGLLTGIANAVALPFQLFLLTRIVNQVGVGWTNLFYPVLAVATFGSLSGLPLLPLAILALFVRTAFLWGIRNPIDTMLYNAVPRVVKGRARAFINAIMLPIATLIAGAMLFFVPRGSTLSWYLIALGGLVALVYLVSSWFVRRAYSQALVETLAVEDADIYQMAGAEWDAADRAALDHVLTRLREAQDEGTTIFLAQLAYEVGSRDAVPILIDIAAERSPTVRAAVIEIVGAAGLVVPEVLQLCTGGIGDPDPNVRRAALAVLEEQSGPENLPLLGLALDLLRDDDLGVRTRAISLLLRSGDFYYLTTAASALNELLARDDATLRARALTVLGEMGDPRFVRTLAPFISDPAETVRRAAMCAIAAVTTDASPAWARQLALESAQKAIDDPAEAVRLYAVQLLGSLGPSEARASLLQLLRDSSPRVRENARQALERMGSDALESLEVLLATDSDNARATAMVALLNLAAERYRDQAYEQIDESLQKAYADLVLMDALVPLEFTAAALLMHTLNERNQVLLERIFRILEALHGSDAISVIEHNLRSDDERARANAVEALEALTSPLIARFTAPLMECAASTCSATIQQTIVQAEEEFSLQRSEPAQAVEQLLASGDPWLTAVTLQLLLEAGKPGLALLDAPPLISRSRREQAIKAALESPDPLVAETVRRVAAHFRLLPKGEEVPTMLSTIEKVIFLKEVPFFSGMTVTQLRALAGIAEEVSFQGDEMIFREGEPGTSLYVIVNGRVGIEHAAEGSSSVARLATLEPRHYFGETSIFDQSPRSASAIAVGQTLLLSIRREPLVALVENNPTLALELIRVLNRRLRETNEQLASRTKARPRELQKFYDKFLES